MSQFEIKYGLGGGFGGYGDWEPCFSCKDIKEAEEFAYECAVAYYESYVGSNGILSYEEIAEENPDFDEEDIQEEYNETMESWIVYKAREKK